MKALILAFTLFAGSSVIKITFDVWDTLVRPHDCLAVRQVTRADESELVYEGHIPCPFDE